MGKYLERCKELRADASRHYGCSQAVFIPVAEDYGMDHETAFKVSSNFRAGMLTGSVCGAVTGGLMALGLADASNQLVMEYLKRLKEAHDGSLDCNVLLDRWSKLGNTNRKPHCDGMCFECMALVEELLGVAD